MNQLESITSSELVVTLGQTILHSLWQGALIGAICWFLMSLAKKENYLARYWINLAGILSVSILAVITFITLYTPSPSIVPELHPASTGSGIFNHVMGDGRVEGSNGVSIKLAWVFPYISGMWLIGFLYFSLRMMGSLLYIRRIVIKRIPFVSLKLNEKVAWISQKLHISKVIELAESAKVSVPTIVGHIKPILLFPIGALAGLPVSQIEAIISHELAHIKRNDYLINLVISVIEVLFFFNPAIWWLNSRIKTDREILCDDLALSVTGDPTNYAKALSSLLLMAQADHQLSLAFIGKKGQVLNRIQRIYNHTQMKTREKKLPALLLVLIMASFAILFSSSIQPSQEPGKIKEIAGSVVKQDTAVHTKVTIDGKAYQVYLKWNHNKILHFELNGEIIQQKDYTKFDRIISQAKKLAVIDVPPEIANFTIEMPEIADLAITMPALADMVIQMPEIPDLAIAMPEIAALSIEMPEIPDLAIALPELPDLAIEMPEIPDLAIAMPDLATLANIMDSMIVEPISLGPIGITNPLDSVEGLDPVEPEAGLEHIQQIIADYLQAGSPIKVEVKILEINDIDETTYLRLRIKKGDSESDNEIIRLKINKLYSPADSISTKLKEAIDELKLKK
jgi:beta-lactamase regulating signal transducer with metallopeptidase domain